MPYVRILAAGSPLAPGQITALQRGITRLLNRLLGKREAVTVATVLNSPTERWSVGGKALADGSRCAQVDAYITAGTNQCGEIALFIGEVHELLGEVLGPFAAPSYVMVHELDAQRWGYDGATQAARRKAAVVVA